MVEGLRVERQDEDVRLLELHVGETSSVCLGLRFCKGVCEDVDRDDACARTIAGEGDRLGADATPSLEDSAAFRARAVRVDQVHHRFGLLLPAQAISSVAAV